MINDYDWAKLALRKLSKFAVGCRRASHPFTMSYENILLEIRDAVALVTLNRPKVLNALNRATLRELDAAFEEISSNDDVRAVLLTGAGEKAFAAGADIQELAALSAIEGQELALRGQRIFRRSRISASR